MAEVHGAIVSTCFGRHVDATMTFTMEVTMRQEALPHWLEAVTWLRGSTHELLRNGEFLEGCMLGTAKLISLLA